jgi:membrane-bound lytic murein transglycosylase D
LAPLDPILDSPWAIAQGMEEEVRFWIESFQTREAEVLRESLVRMGRYRGVVDAELANRRLPSSLAFLPIVESWYSPTAVSHVGAGGLWQFMAPTARGLGLRVNRLVDERRDPFQATPRALDFLSQLHDKFGSWFLALAAYNGGPGRLERALRRRAPDTQAHDGLFLEVRGDLPRETRDFVPRFLAAAVIARDPESYGFGDVVPDGPLAYDEVEVEDATSLDVVAMAAGVELELVEALNPQLLRGLTPAGVGTRVRIPEGSGTVFAEAYPRIPPEERVTFLEHMVASGETLSHIAREYGVTVDDLRAANPRIEPRRMQIGQRVVVPKAPSARAALRNNRSGMEEPAVHEPLIYRVRSGDTLTAIAARHRVRVGDLLRWNDLTWEAIIMPGDEVKIYLGGGGI